MIQQLQTTVPLVFPDPVNLTYRRVLEFTSFDDAKVQAYASALSILNGYVFNQFTYKQGKLVIIDTEMPAGTTLRIARDIEGSIDDPSNGALLAVKPTMQVTLSDAEGNSTTRILYESAIYWIHSSLEVKVEAKENSSRHAQLIKLTAPFDGME